MHEGAVVVVEYFPAAQIKQLVPETNCPAVQVVGVPVQLALPAALVVPPGQAVQSAAASCL